MNQIQKQVPEKVVELLQRLCYEASGLKVLYTHALNAGVAKEKLNGIQREFLERHQEYELAKQEMWSRFSGDYSGAEWRLDFGTGTIHIRERENHAQE